MLMKKVQISIRKLIDSFAPASPGTVEEGEIFTLSWQTSNITNVTLNTPGYESLPEDVL